MVRPRTGSDLVSKHKVKGDGRDGSVVMSAEDSNWVIHNKPVTLAPGAPTPSRLSAPALTHIYLCTDAEVKKKPQKTTRVHSHTGG